MKLGSLRISLPAVYLPVERATIPTSADIQERERFEQAGYISLAREPSLEAGHMALRAAEFLGEHIGADRISMAGTVIHSCIHDQGMGAFWNPGYAILDAISATSATAYSLKQGCNGLFESILLAAKGGIADERDTIIVGSDRFEGPSFDRYSADYGIMYGDASAAIMLSRTTGQFYLLDACHVRAPALVGLHDGSGLSFSDIRSAKKRYLICEGNACLVAETRAAMLRVAKKLNAQDAARILFPHLGRSLLEENYFPAFDAAEERSAIKLGSSLGHLGTTDQFVALAQLWNSGDITSGDRVLLIGAGSGFSWTGLILEAI